MYERDVLEDFDPKRKPTYPEREAHLGLVVEDRASGFVGDIVKMSFEAVTLRSRRNEHRHFRWKPGGFLIDGRPVTLVRPTAPKPTGPTFTASGSISTGPVAARTARASRIWVEGRHDAELLEHVWGDDLRELGIVVEPLHGIDNLASAVGLFAPSATRRLGVLVDHLVSGSKEARLAASVKNPNVLVTGHPFVDVWAGIRPSIVGRDEWPTVPRDVEWKQGVCEALGVRFDGFWPALRNKVTSYKDLRPELVGAVERLIDFVSELEG